MKKEKGWKAAAVLTFKFTRTPTKRDLQRMANWLGTEASDLMKYGHMYFAKQRSWYYYPARENPLNSIILTINHAKQMSAKGKRDVAAWIEQQADDLVNFGKQYAPTLRARYLCAYKFFYSPLDRDSRV